MTIFSFGLLVIVTAFLALLGFYQNGTQSRIVQTAARSGINSIVQSARQAKWLAYNANTVCVEAGTPVVFYLDPVAHQIMEAHWQDTAACTSGAIIGSAQPVTTRDAQAAALIAEPTENNAGTLDSACTAAPCAGGTQMTSLRITLRVASNLNFLNPPVTGSSCAPSAPAYCVITALSTSVTAGEGEFQ